MQKRFQNKRGKVWIVIIIVAVATLLVIGGIYSYEKYFKKEPKKPVSSQTYSYQPTNNAPRQEPVYGIATDKDYKNLEEVLAKNQVIKELPEDSKIVLAFYNFNNGERQWEKSYLLNKGSAKEGNLDDYDIKVIIHSKYITVLNENNLCDILQRAQRNGDFASETQMSKLSLAWKYSSILDYRSCFGL